MRLDGNACRCARSREPRPRVAATPALGLEGGVLAGGLIAPWTSTERDSLFAAPAVSNGSIADWLVGAITKANAQRQHQRRFGRRLYQRPRSGADLVPCIGSRPATRTATVGALQRWPTRGDRRTFHRACGAVGVGTGDTGNPSLLRRCS